MEVLIHPNKSYCWYAALQFAIKRVTEGGSSAENDREQLYIKI